MKKLIAALVAAFLIGFFPLRALAAISLVQSTSNTGARGTITVTLGSTPTAGDAMILAWGCVGSGAGGTPPTITGYTQLQADADTNNFAIALYDRVAQAGDSASLIVPGPPTGCSTANFTIVLLAEFSGTSPITPVSTSQKQFDAGLSCPCTIPTGTMTATAANSLALGMFYTDTTVTTGSGFTSVVNATGASTFTLSMIRSTGLIANGGTSTPFLNESFSGSDQASTFGAMLQPPGSNYPGQGMVGAALFEQMVATV